MGMKEDVYVRLDTINVPEDIFSGKYEFCRKFSTSLLGDGRQIFEKIELEEIMSWRDDLFSGVFCRKKEVFTEKKESTWPEECNHVNGNPRTGRDSEWRDLDIDNLPNDISKGCDIYDFQIFYPIPGWVKSVSGIAAILRMAESGDHMFRYRERKQNRNSRAMKRL